MVVCRQLGFQFGRMARSGQQAGCTYGPNGTTCTWDPPQFGSGSGPVLLSDVAQCSPLYDGSLSDCSRPKWQLASSCSGNFWAPLHAFDVGVICGNDTIPAGSPPPRDFDVRLSGGPSPREGRLEVYYNGTWGTLGERQSMNDGVATVACRQLGFSYGRMTRRPLADQYNSQMLMPVQYSQPLPLPQILDSGLVCNPATATSLPDCFAWQQGWMRTRFGYANHSFDASVECSNGSQPLDFDVRLVNGTTPKEGVLLLHYNGTWHTVCEQSLGNHGAATVVMCRQLGYDGGRILKGSTLSARGASTASRLVLSAYCDTWSSLIPDGEGLQTSINECSYYMGSQWDADACSAERGRNAVMRCHNDGDSLLWRTSRGVARSGLVDYIAGMAVQVWWGSHTMPLVSNALWLGSRLLEAVGGIAGRVFSISDIVRVADQLAGGLLDVSSVTTWLQDHLFDGAVPLTGFGKPHYGPMGEELRVTGEQGLALVVQPALRVLLDTDTGSVISDYLLRTQSITVSELVSTSDLNNLLGILRASVLGRSVELAVGEPDSGTRVQPLVEGFLKDVLRYLDTEIREGGRLSAGQAVLDLARGVHELLVRALGEGLAGAREAKAALLMSDADRRAFGSVAEWVRKLLANPRSVADLANYVYERVQEAL